MVLGSTRTGPPAGSVAGSVRSPIDSRDYFFVIRVGPRMRRAILLASDFDSCAVVGFTAACTGAGVAGVAGAVAGKVGPSIWIFANTWVSGSALPDCCCSIGTPRSCHRCHPRLRLGPTRRYGRDGRHAAHWAVTAPGGV